MSEALSKPTPKKGYYFVEFCCNNCGQVYIKQYLKGTKPLPSILKRMVCDNCECSNCIEKIGG